MTRSDDTERREVLKEALHAIEELEKRLAAAEAAPRQPIAIVGMACRFPGGADDPEAYWRLLRAGVDAIQEVPAERWDVARFFDPDPSVPGKTYTRWGGFLRQVDLFDAHFFSIAPREAIAMDPQQRLFLEVAWEALERGGQAPGRLVGSQTGVFAGVTMSEYLQLSLKRLSPAELDAYLTPGTVLNAVAGRVSYLLGLHGPALAVDTACSSSLVAVHLACQSLRAGECDRAIAGGVNVVLAPETFICFSKWGMMAKDGRCKTFDAAADGFVRGEGCGVVVLKRLSDALADGDEVLAVIRGSAVNQDGPSSGLTVPNGLAQQAVIQAALANAGVAPSEVGYVEAHGTGTSLGDPIEVEALAAALGAGGSPEVPLLIGSVKTNLGHLESSAGVAGLIKVVLALQHGEIPPSLHFKHPSPHIPWERMAFSVPTTPTPWPTARPKRVAGVSAFGFSGTNAHVVLEEAPRWERPSAALERPLHLLALSAKNERALKELAERYRQRLVVAQDLSFADVAHSANVGRAHFAHRLTLAAASSEEARAKLENVVSGDATAGVLTGQATTSGRPRITFLFTGQGSQYVGMGQVLYHTQPTFRRTLETCAALLRPYLERPLLSVLFPERGDASPLDETAYTQPALFALEYALCELWRSWGVEPWAVMGHSVGEYVAACVAGVFGLEDGLRLIAERGRLMQSLPRDGEMAALFTDEERVVAALAAHAGDVSIAAINGPRNVVISGRAGAVEAVLETLASEGVQARRLQVSHAFHSPLMEPILSAFEGVVSGVRLQPPRISLISNLTGRTAGAEVAAPDYWRRHLRQAVRFSSGIETLHAKGCGLFLEIGPSPTLSSMGANCLPEGVGVWLTSLRKGKDEWQSLLECLARLYHQGVEVDWRGFDRDYPRRRVTLPTYPFQRERYWIKDDEPRTVSTERRERSDGATHPLLGERLRSPLLRGVVYESRVRAGAPAFLNDHRVHGTVVFPATAYLEMVWAAARDAMNPARYSLEDVAIGEPLVLSDQEVRSVQIALESPGPTGASFQVFSAEGEGEAACWRQHVSGVIRTDGWRDSPETSPLPQVRANCTEEVAVESFYSGLRGRGLDFGPGFQGIEKLWRRSGESLGRVRLPNTMAGEAGRYHIHPALLDACLQVLVAAWPAEVRGAAATDTYLPLSVESYELDREAGPLLWSHATLRPQGGSGVETRIADVDLLDEDGRRVGQIRGFLVKRAGRDVVERASRSGWSDWLYRVEWRSKPLTQPETPREPALRRALEEVAANVGRQVNRLSVAHELETYRALLPQVESLATRQAVEGLRRLGLELRAGQRFSAEATAHNLGIADRHHRLFLRLMEILVEDGVLRPEDGSWEVCRTPEGAATDHWQSLLEGYPDSAPQIRLVERCAKRLPEALQGHADPLQLLFPGGSLAALEALYERSPFSQLYNGLVAEAVRSLLESLPEGRKLRVLEIGAGTGGTTSALLPLFPVERTEFVFTDISPVFTARGREKFVQYPFLRFKTLDIESEPAVQGFEPHGFDLVLAANVVHATADLRRTLRHVRGLLAPEGVLILVEGTRPQRWIDLTFGLTEGWWKFTDAALRPSYALLERQRWLDVLTEVGFTAPAAVPGVSEPDPDGQTVLFARGPRIKQAPASVMPGAQRGKGHWLVLADAGGVGERLVALLTARGESVTVVKAPDLGGHELGVTDGCRPEELAGRITQVLAQDGRNYSGVVHLWALDAALSEAATAAELEDLEERVCGGTLHVVQALLAQPGAVTPRLWLVTRGAQMVRPGEGAAAVAQAPLWGLGKVVGLEHPELHCVRVDLDPSSDKQVGEQLLEEILAGDAEEQVAWRDGGRYVARLTRYDGKADLETLTASVRLETTAPGQLDGLALRPTRRQPPGPGEVEIRVSAVGLNFRDVLNALGLYPGDAGPLGGECAGHIVAVGEGVQGFQVGDAVLGIALGSFSTFVTTRAELIVPKPRSMDFEEAATVASAFMTAHYTLDHLARLRARERVLIHAAAGGVGLAAVQLAQRAGAEVFATAGSPEKREYLKHLGIRHVMDSRSLDFADEVLAATGGEGVDIVLNSLSGEFIPRGLSTLRAGGRFVEIGKRGAWDATQVSQLRGDVTYFLVDLAEAASRQPGLIGSLLRELMPWFERGELKPLPRRLFPLEEAAGAFRYMAQAKHIGKIVVTLRPGGVTPSLPFDPQGTYLITGGLAGLGLLAARWAVERGARHLALMGRSAPSSLAAQAIRDFEGAGVRVLVFRGDVSREEDLAGLLGCIRETMPPLRGIIHSAGVLDDGAVVQQEWPRFAKVMAPKVRGGWNLHRMTQNITLDWFILFSSAAALIGSRGQSNHAAANAFLDALAHYRRRRGLAALSINWGAWSEIGAAAERGVGDRVKVQGMGTIAPQKGLAVLERLMADHAVQVGVVPMDWSRFLGQAATGAQRFFSEIAPVASSSPQRTQAVDSAADIRALLSRAPASRRRKLLVDHVRARAVKVLGLDPARPIDERQPLNELGMDSLMAVELRNLLGSLDPGRPLPATLLFDYPSLGAVADYLGREVLGWEAPAEVPAEATGEAEAVLGALSEEQAEAALIDELSALRTRKEQG